MAEPNANSQGDNQEISLLDLADQVATDGRARVIITMNEDMTGIDWTRCAWVKIPIAMALSVIVDFLPGFRALEQRAVYGVTEPLVAQNAQEGPPDAPQAAEATTEGNVS